MIALQFLVFLAFAPLADGATPVVLAGDSTIVSALQHSLADRRVLVVSGQASGAVHVYLQPDPAGIRLFIHDRNGNVIERIAANPDVAAAVVEAWVRDDLARPLLEPHDVAMPEGAPVLTTPSVRGPLGATPGLGVTLAGETALATDGSLWMGAALGTCVRVGALCVGIKLRVAGDTATTGKVGARYLETAAGSSTSCSAESRKLERLAADALLTADLRVRIGPGTFGPQIGLGAGWLSTSATVGEHSANATTIGLRAEPGVLLTWPLFGGVAVDGGLWANILPFAHRTRFATDGFDLPSEPLGFLRAGLGFHYGAIDSLH